MSQIIYAMIQHRAAQKAGKNQPDFDDWRKLWFAAAEEIKGELEAEKLQSTADYLKGIIASQRRLITT